MMLPEALQEPVLLALQQAGDPTPVRQAVPTQTGGVSTTLRLTSAQGDYFVKWNETPQFGLFRAEAQDLDLIRQTRTVRVPDVLAWAEATATSPGYMIQEWLPEPTEAAGADRTGARLGARLAAMHRASAEHGAPGCGQHDHHGPEPSETVWYSDWSDYFRDRMLRPQMESAAREGFLTEERRRRCEVIAERLGEWLGGVPRRPSLLHGDLHVGNVLSDAAGEPVLIDPWAFYGDREWEVAFTTVWGYHPPEFYAAYDEVWPLPDGFEERRDLYLLTSHLWFYKDAEVNAARIDAILKRYAD